MQLIIASEAAPAPLSPTQPGVEVWRDLDDRICALGALSGAQHRMDVPGVGTFTFGATPEVRAQALPGVSRALVRDAYVRMVLPMALQATGLEVLHGSAVLTPHGVLALCARSETGKSTVAFGLARRGHPLMADDAVALCVAERPPTVLPTPFAVRLRRASAVHFGEQPHPDTNTLEWREPEGDAPRPLAAICLLSRLDGGDDEPPVHLERLSPATAFKQLLPHAYCFSFEERARKVDMMRRYGALAGMVPVFSLAFRSGLEHLPAILDAAECATRPPVAG